MCACLHDAQGKLEEHSIHKLVVEEIQLMNKIMKHSSSKTEC